jgi:Uma2 family endonuclease
MTTQAAEGMPRRLWTVAEIEAMVEAGIIEEDERFELIDGEVVPMSPKGSRHEWIKGSLNMFWAKRLPDHVHIIPETTFRLDEKSFLEPDFVFFPANSGLKNLSPSTVLLAVEVADSSLRYDTGRKAMFYAIHGVKELWVIEAKSLKTHVFKRPTKNGYSSVKVVKPSETLKPAFAPELALKLAELPLI